MIITFFVCISRQLDCKCKDGGTVADHLKNPLALEAGEKALQRQLPELIGTPKSASDFNEQSK